MGRIRTIKPEFAHSETMGRVSREARLLFILLWTVADDHGNARGHSRALASVLFPYDEDARELIDGWLDELEAVEAILRYGSDGEHFIHICKWLKHQKIDRPSQPRFPPPREPSRDTREPSTNTRRWTKDQGPRTKEGSGGAQARPRARAAGGQPEGDRDIAPASPTEQLAPGVDTAALEDWRRHREAVGKPLRPHELIALGKTLLALGEPGIQREVVQTCIGNGWLNIRVADKPSPRLADGPRGDAERAWAELLATEGVSRGPRVSRALEAIGGWSAVRGRTLLSEPRLRAEFCRAYAEAMA